MAAAPMKTKKGTVARIFYDGYSCGWGQQVFYLREVMNAV
jgi:hypothetical protein